MFNIHDDNNDKMAYFGDYFKLIFAFYEFFSNNLLKNTR